MNVEVEQEHKTSSGVGVPWANRPGFLLFVCVFIVIAYALPLFGTYLLNGHVADVLCDDEIIYLSRTLDAAAGGSLANPYLAEDQQNPKYMPEISERTLGDLSRWFRIDPRSVTAASRVVVPLLILLLTFRLARDLEVGYPMAVMAGLLVTLMPSVAYSFLHPQPDYLGFLRYERLISPGTHLVLFLLWMLTLQRVWRKGATGDAVLAGLGLGAMITLLAPYYWSYALAGTVAVTVRSPKWRALVLVLVIGIIVGTPSIINYRRLNSLPAVQDTLTRFEVMTRTHMPSRTSIGLAIGTSLVVLALWRSRRRLGSKAEFLIPILSAAAVLFLQCVVTGRDIQNEHWMYAALPLAYIAIAALWDVRPEINRGRWYAAVAAVLMGGALFSQCFAVRYLNQEMAASPDWGMEEKIPQTISWIKQNLPPDSVLLARDAYAMEMLHVTTGRKVYWSAFAGQHVVSSQDAATRSAGMQWSLTDPQHLPYRADYFVGFGDECSQARPGSVRFHDANEGTCLVQIPR